MLSRKKCSEVMEPLFSGFYIQSIIKGAFIFWLKLDKFVIYTKRIKKIFISEEKTVFSEVNENVIKKYFSFKR